MNLERIANLENVSLDLEATHPTTGEKAKNVFCKDWPAAKNGLELVQAIVKNPIVKLIVSIVITIGDGISTKVCGEASAEAAHEG